MSKVRRKALGRILAFALSIAMVTSNMSVAASPVTETVAVEASTEVATVAETETTTETGTATTESTEASTEKTTETTTAESTEASTEKTTETTTVESTTEASTEKATETTAVEQTTEASTETTTESASEDVEDVVVEIEGVKTVYDFRDGSIVPTDTDGKATVSSLDGKVTVACGPSNAYAYNGAQHGVQFKTGNTVTINVPEKAQIWIGGCQYSKADATVTFSMDGTDIDTINTITSTCYHQDEAAVVYTYECKA